MIVPNMGFHGKTWDIYPLVHVSMVIPIIIPTIKNINSFLLITSQIITIGNDIIDTIIRAIFLSVFI
tara:strand:+ start:1556 stop:1756 length:201 start_codon:yes stop_codon:yes gene_type:complete